MIEKLKNRKPIFYIKLAVVAVLVCAVLTGCDEFVSWQTDFSLKRDRSWYMDIRCQATPYPLDDVTIDFYLGFREKDETVKRDFTKTENAYWGIYLCNTEALKEDANVVVSDYQNIENYYFIKKISDRDAFTSDQYCYTVNGKSIVYESHETIKIPRTVLETYGRKLGVVLLYITPDENNSYAIRQTSFGILLFDYQIIDDEYVKIDLSNAVLTNY